MTRRQGRGLHGMCVRSRGAAGCAAVALPRQGRLDAAFCAKRTTVVDLFAGTATDDWAGGMTVDSSGNVYLGGTTSGSLPNNSLAGYWDGYLAKYNTSGVQQWLRQFGTS